MSDAELMRELDRMESWISDPQQMPGPDVLADWNKAFRIAMADAERGLGWPELVARSHALGKRVDGRAVMLAAERDQVRADLDAQERGGRALKGYGAVAR